MAEAFSDHSSSDSNKMTKNTIANGIFDLLKPAVEEIDDRVKFVRKSQVELRVQIDNVGEDLKQIEENVGDSDALQSYVRKLNNSRRRVTVINSILQNVQERLHKLQQNVLKETTGRSTLLDPFSSKSQ